MLQSNAGARPPRARSLTTAVPILLAAALTVSGCTETTPTSPTAEVQMSAAHTAAAPAASMVASGLLGASGSAIGPGGALFVAESAVGRISRVDPRTGEVTPFATGLPPSLIGLGGVIDIAFVGSTAYALVTLVGPDVGGSDVVGLYRVDGPDDFTVIADVGAYSIANPPSSSFFVPTGVQFAMEHYRNGFLVTDGHHNRVLHVSFGGEISEVRAFGNIVPTGIDVWGDRILMARAGPVPHLFEDGMVLAFTPKSSGTTVVATGGRLLVDTELGRGKTLYGLAQGEWDGVAEGSPAVPNDGSLLRADDSGAFHVVIDGLDRPSSLEIVGDVAWVLTLTGEVWKITGIE